MSIYFSDSSFRQLFPKAKNLQKFSSCIELKVEFSGELKFNTKSGKD